MKAKDLTKANALNAAKSLDTLILIAKVVDFIRVITVIIIRQYHTDVLIKQ